MPRHFHAVTIPGFQRLLALGAMILFLLVAVPAGAQELDPNSPPPARDYVSCGHFETQADAQAALDAGTLDEIGMQSLDGDGDGIACEDAFLDPNSAPPANDYVSCGHFETQEDAQAALDSGELDATGRESLDGDGDGIACEVRWGEPATGATKTTTVAVQLPNTGAGVTAASSERGMMAAGVMLVSGVTLLVGRRLARR